MTEVAHPIPPEVVLPVDVDVPASSSSAPSPSSSSSGAISDASSRSSFVGDASDGSSSSASSMSGASSSSGIASESSRSPSPQTISESVEPVDEEGGKKPDLVCGTARQALDCMIEKKNLFCSTVGIYKPIRTMAMPLAMGQSKHIKFFFTKTLYTRTFKSPGPMAPG